MIKPVRIRRDLAAGKQLHRLTVIDLDPDEVLVRVFPRNGKRRREAQELLVEGARLRHVAHEKGGVGNAQDADCTRAEEARFRQTLELGRNDREPRQSRNAAERAPYRWVWVGSLESRRSSDHARAAKT